MQRQLLIFYDILKEAINSYKTASINPQKQYAW